jgi:hypothetical protein
VPLAGDEERAFWAQYLATARDTQINTTEVTELLLREVKYLIDTKIDLIKGTDGKAALAVTVLGGGIGVISVLGATQSAMVLSGNPVLLGFAVVFVVVGVVFDLICLARGYRYTSHMPRIDVYNSQVVLDNRHMQGRVGTSLVEGYLEYSNELTALSARKSSLLKTATILLSLGVLCFTVNGALASIHPGRPGSNADCTFSRATIDCIIRPR